MNVSVRIIVASRHDVVQVPVEAVSRDEDGNAVVNVVDANGKTTPRPVTVGLSSNKNIEIVKGLKEGERVALPQAQAAGEGD
jgi:membrane fusion protein (multidrug efflux system)